MPAFHQFLSLSFTVMVSCTGAYCDDPYTPWAETTFVEDNYTLIVGFYPPREVTALEVQALMQPLGAELTCLDTLGPTGNDNGVCYFVRFPAGTCFLAAGKQLPVSYSGHQVWSDVPKPDAPCRCLTNRTFAVVTRQ